MKKLYLLAILILMSVASLMAQHVPAGMKYQAVARSLTGSILANQEISLKMNLFSMQGKNTLVHYSEVHTAKTNELGLFTLVIGEGKAEKGSFSNVPWSTEDIWMEVAIKDKGNSFSTISSSKLLAVPYAFHAATASQLVYSSSAPNMSAKAEAGVPSQVWSLKGNSRVEPGDNLGTTELADLVIITNNIERIRVTSAGDVMFKNSLSIDKDLTVKGNVNLNTVSGSTVNNGPLTVAKSQPTTLTGTLAVTQATDLKSTLTVAGATNLNSTLKVNNAAATGLTGTLTVDKATVLNNSLTVANASATNLTGTLSVAQATDLNNSVKVAGPTTLNSSLTVANVAPAALTGTLAVDKDATFKQKVLVTNSALGSTSASTGALVVNGGVGIGQNLNVGGAANFGGSSSFGGKLLITDATASPNTTTGAAVITGGVGIGKELNVGGATSLGSSLKVTGATTVGQTLNVTGATSLANTLQVTGATTLANTLQVTGATTLQNKLTVNKLTTFNDSVVLNSALSSKSLAVSNSADEFVAVLENTNGSNGDGLKIKLGRTNPMWNGSSYASTPNIAADAFQMPINTIRGWVIDHNPVQASDLLHLFPHTLIAGTIVNIVNTVTDQINQKLSLPISVGPYGIPAMDIVPKIDGIGGPWGIPATNVLPQITVFPRIPQIPDVGLPSFSVPNLSFTDVTNSLTNENEFVTFVDKDNRKLGTVRAQSINDFSADYLDGVYFVNLMASLVGIDIVGGIAGAVKEFTNLADAYNSIGVEYSSGHGDYAEWLERINPDETISAGDIVAVKGGKITRDLTNAEQVMAVSYKPIVLGNTPPEGQDGAGNKVAFMGQIPVKVMGPVKAGDYIVAKSKLTGYGIAIHPSEMSVNDHKLSVGRAWETNVKEGPKMINTLIGVDNGAYINILKRNQEKVNKIETRMNSLEQKMKPLFSNQTTNQSSLKGRKVKQ